MLIHSAAIVTPKHNWKEKKTKINEVWEDRNKYKAASDARLKELEAAHQHLEEVNREIEANHLSLALLDRKLVDARMTMLAWTMLEEDQVPHRGSFPSSTLTYERARTSLTPEALEGYLLQRAEKFYHFQPDLKGIVEAHSKLLSPAVRWVDSKSTIVCLVDPAPHAFSFQIILTDGSGILTNSDAVSSGASYAT